MLPGSEDKPTKPSREERRAQRRAAADAARLQAQALADAGWRTENEAGPQSAPVTGLQTAEERRHQRKEVIQQAKQAGITLDRGRPSEYTDDEADTIVAWIAEGRSLRKYCEASGRPMIRIQQWLRQNADFHARYARAREERADVLAEEIIDIADAVAKDPTIEGVAAAKLQVDARRWVASKLKPTVWGDKVIHQQQGAISISIGIPAKPQPHAVEVMDVAAKSLSHNDIPDS